MLSLLNNTKEFISFKDKKLKLELYITVDCVFRLTEDKHTTEYNIVSKGGKLFLISFTKDVEAEKLLKLAERAFGSWLGIEAFNKNLIRL